MCPEYATCERTGVRTAIADGYFVANYEDGEWQFISREAPEHATDYPILAREFATQPRTLVNSLAHLSEKTWFKPHRFFAFMHELRANADRTAQA